MKRLRKKRERIVRKKGWAKIGVFMLGLFLGIITALGSLVGIGFWAYKNLNLNKIEKITNKTIDIGNDSLKKITIEDIVTNISGITNDKNYTIAKLENDFGITVIGDDGLIPAELYGLDLTSLKNNTLKNLGEGFERIVGNASLNTFLSFLESSDEDLGMFANIVNTKLTYYTDNAKTKLYEDESRLNPVSFDYEIMGNTVKLDSNKNATYDIINNEISVQFRHVAIESAFSSFDKVTDNLKIYKILDYHYNESNKRYYEDENYTKELTGFMKILADKSIGDLSSSSFFDNLKIYEVFGYYYNEQDQKYYNYYDGTNYSEQVTLQGIKKALAQKSINDLNKDGVFDDIYICDVLNLYYYNGSYYEDANHTTKVNSVLNAIAGKTINELNNEDVFDDIKLYEVLNLHKYNNEYYEDEAHQNKVNGVINSIAEKTISQLSNDDTFNNIYIYEVMNYTFDNSKYYTDNTKSTEVTGVLGAVAGSTVGNLSTAIDDVKLGQVLNLENPTGVLKALKDTEIKNLETKINDLTLTQALDLDGTETGVLKALRSKKITELKTAIDDLTLTQALDLDGTETGILKTLSRKKITELEQAISDLTLGEALGINENEAKGAILSFYDTKISELNNKLNPENLDIYKALGYTYDEETGKYYNGTTEVTGVMATLAGYKLNNVENAIENIKVKDVLPSNSPILALFDENEKESLTISTLSSSVVTKMNEATIGKLIDCGLICVEGTINDTVRGMTIKQLINIATGS